jgi:hypothetical protein
MVGHRKHADSVRAKDEVGIERGHRAHREQWRGRRQGAAG